MACCRVVASYGYELMTACPDLDVIYVPIGLGSGICSTIAVRDALGLKTEVVGVVSENAAAYALSFAAGKPVSTNSAETMADGMACRVPVAEAGGDCERRCGGGSCRVSDAEIKVAMRGLLYRLPPGGGGRGEQLPWRPRCRSGGRLAGKTVGLVLERRERGPGRVCGCVGGGVMLGAWVGQNPVKTCGVLTRSSR